MRMKKIILTLSASLILSCGGNPEKKKGGFEYNRTKKEESKSVVKSGGVPIDLNNKGIGPVKDISFDLEIDLELAAQGEKSFTQKCTACHKTDAKFMGPAMKGIYERRHPAWVMNMLMNPTQMVKEDPIAKALLAEYNNILMINQNLSQDEARAISEYLRTL